MTRDQLLLCCNCEKFSHHWRECRDPRAGVEPVWGKRMQPAEQRADENLCGKDGRWFVPLNKEKR